jgi:hypothetical protein
LHDQQTPFARVFPTTPQGFNEPFWYGSLQSFWLYYRADPDDVAARLPDGLEAALFDFEGHRHALVSLDFQAYTGHGPGYLEMTHEVEFNVYAYPRVRLPDVPALTLREFLAGEDQTKTVGGFRIHVPCDNPNAVKAGIGLYGEPPPAATSVHASSSSCSSRLRPTSGVSPRSAPASRRVAAVVERVAR